MCAVASAVLLAGCGADTNFITGEEYEYTAAPAPTTPAEMRSDVQSVIEYLNGAVVKPDGSISERHAAACSRLNTLLTAMDDGFGRYDIGGEAYRVLGEAYSRCNDEPARATEFIRHALALPPRDAPGDTGPPSGIAAESPREFWDAWEALVPRLDPSRVQPEERLAACAELRQWAERLFDEGGNRYSIGSFEEAEIRGLAFSCADQPEVSFIRAQRVSEGNPFTKG